MAKQLSSNRNRSADSAQECEDICFWIEKYYREFPTDEDCWRALLALVGITEDRFSCRICGVIIANVSFKFRSVKCQACKRINWFSAGTFFQGVKNFRAWHGQIWMREHGITMSQEQAGLVFGSAQSTAWNVFHSLSSVAAKEMDVEQCQAVPSDLFMSLFGKRSRVTPAHEHPNVEQRESENHHNISIQETDAALLETLKPEEAQLYEHLSFDVPKSVDKLQALTRLSISELLGSLVMLELKGMAERLPGDCHIKRRRMQRSDGAAHHDSTLVRKIIQYVRRYFGSISRKYLQHYIAAYWCSVWKPGALRSACRRSPPVTDRKLLQYVTPPMVNVPAS